MRITHLGHACLLVEMADTRVLLDPGTFAGDLSALRDLDAVLVDEGVLVAERGHGHALDGRGPPCMLAGLDPEPGEHLDAHRVAQDDGVAVGIDEGR